MTVELLVALKVLFLDVDGVLNSEDYYEKTVGRGLDVLDKPKTPEEEAWLEKLLAKYGTKRTADCWLHWLRCIDPDAVARLDRIVRTSGCKVVLSSSWRKIVDLDEMQMLLELKGFSGELIGRTPSRVPGAKFSEYVPRGREILWWMNNEAKQEVTQWSIVDDDDGMEGCKWKLVQTDFQHGLRDEEADRIIKMLED